MTSTGQKTLNEAALNKIIRRVVETASPEKIILFGSTARGEAGQNSDIDLLVIKAKTYRRRLAQKIYKNLLGVGRAVDIIVATPEDIARYKNSDILIIGTALREGKVVYAA